MSTRLSGRSCAGLIEECVAVPDRVPLVRMRSISKAFGPTLAVDGVDLDLLPGEIHCLVAENGAGKSTLIRVLSASYTDEAGQQRVAGRAGGTSSPAAPRATVF